MLLLKGDPYLTRNSRQKTLRSGRDLYLHPGGLGCPLKIVREIKVAAWASEARRAAAVAEKDRKDTAAAKAVIECLYPRMPAFEVDNVLKHAFKKRSGRVGRTGKKDLDSRVVLAVTAYARHQHTAYEALLRQGKDRDQARERIRKTIDQVLKRWRPDEFGQKTAPVVAGTKEDFKDYVSLSSNSESTDDGIDGEIDPEYFTLSSDSEENMDDDTDGESDRDNVVEDTVAEAISTTAPTTGYDEAITRISRPYLQCSNPIGMDESIEVIDLTAD